MQGGGCSPAAVAQLIDNVRAGEGKRDAAHDSAGEKLVCHKRCKGYSE